MTKLKIVSFDMDGTLTRGGTSLQFYASELGKQERAKELETLYKTHQIDDIKIAEEYALMLKGLSKTALYKLTRKIPKVKNIGETIKALKGLGLRVGITSVGPSFTSEAFQQWFGFDFISGSTHEFKNDIHTGKMIKTLSGKDKLAIVESECVRHHATLSQVIAIGDSRSDIPIFEKAGYSIAFNADDNLKDKAKLFLQSEDLLKIYNAIKKLVV